ncbi:thiopurine S-methyltransferase [Ceratobasidium sp. AG-Ba]|nr:thiopurine S-methyltransferase [Ceratobasidium sp. AG-Ba]
MADISDTKSEKQRQDEQRAATLRVRELLAQTHGGAGWDAAWKEGATPWDAGAPQMPLRQVFETNIVADLNIPKSGRVLVPGCGRGYDAIYFASQGYNVLGADLSPTAINEAKGRVFFLPQSANLKIEYQVIDFFQNFAFAEHPFDIVYDYTFFCAIPPSMRESWGQRMTEIVKPGGYLITLMYPIDPERARNDGPPFPVDVEAYTRVLEQSWEKVLDIVPSNSQPTHQGRERLGIWRKVSEDSSKL